MSYQKVFLLPSSWKVSNLKGIFCAVFLETLMLMTLSFLSKSLSLKLILCFLLTYFSKNSEAVYVGNVITKNMNLTASYQKFLRKVNLNIKNEGLNMLGVA